MAAIDLEKIRRNLKLGIKKIRNEVANFLEPENLKLIEDKFKRIAYNLELLGKISKSLKQSELATKQKSSVIKKKVKKKTRKSSSKGREVKKK